MIKLGNNVFVVPPPTGMRSFALQQRILPVVGRVAGLLSQLIGISGTDATKLLDVDVLKVLPQAVPYIGEIFAQMPDGELERLTRALLREATFDGNALFSDSNGDAFDTLMRGRTADVWRLLWHALEVWYPDFFGLAGSLLAKTGAKENPSKASSTSPPVGPAGA